MPAREYDKDNSSDNIFWIRLFAILMGEPKQ